MPERRRAPRVLVADDDASSRELLENLLSAEGYEVQIARDGEETLALIAETPPDCLVCDVVLPVIDGYEVCRRLKADESTRLIPVVVITGLSDMQQITARRGKNGAGRNRHRGD